MKEMTRSIWTAAVAALLILLSSFLFSQEQPGFLKGKAYLIDKNLSLTQKFEAARKEFGKSKGETYFAGYTFLSRHKHHHGEVYSTEPYRATVEGNKIKMRRVSKWGKEGGESVTTEKGGEPAGIVFLHKVSGSKPEIVDVEMIDLDQSYKFEEAPIYWLGEAKNEESIDFLEKLFDSGNYDVQKALVFIVSSHDHPKSYDFLRRVAMGSYEYKLKKDAIFWLGNYKDARSLAYLKEINKKEKDTKLKEQIVFALQLSDQREAIEELIEIAKNDADRSVRKKAIFWVGQKATKECAKALKDVVESAEDAQVKEAAVFAISQLPKDKSVPMLIEVARSNKSPAVRKKAVFWLGQIDSEEALKFFEEILLKK